MTDETRNYIFTVEEFYKDHGAVAQYCFYGLHGISIFALIMNCKSGGRNGIKF